MNPAPLLPGRNVEHLPGTAMTFTLTLPPQAEHREAAIQHCQELVQAAQASNDCVAAVWGEIAGDSSAVVCHFIFGSDGPFSRFASIRSTNKPYAAFRKAVDPLLTTLPKAQIFHSLHGFVSVRK